MEAGRNLNEAMLKVDETGINPNHASVKSEIEKLKKVQTTQCKDFQFMEGSKMLELQKECETE
jgi:hypothetical protein